MVQAMVSRHHGLLGTTVDVHISARGRRRRLIEQAVLAEIDRLSAVFDLFDTSSELSQYRSGDVAAAGPELKSVLELAETWRTRSNGALNPSTDRLRRIWSSANDRGAMPDQGDIDQAVAALSAAEPPREDLNLNAIAKGWIVDRAVEAGLSAGPATSIWLSAGGDVRHLGTPAINVGIEDPARPHDNVDPLEAVPLAGGAIATSGAARRGWQIGDRWFSHVIDPRTGWPVDHVASASVIAPDAATADALATIVTVLPIDEGLVLVNDTAGASCLIVDRTGETTRSRRWPRTMRSGRGDPDQDDRQQAAHDRQ